MKLIELNLSRIFELCRQYKVRSLSAFGSILTDKFDKDSDVDLLVDFEPHNPDDQWSFDYVSNYFGLLRSLEDLFHRKVDLVEDGDHLNPLFKAVVDKKKLQIYG